jgi:eukaryotic-like serine/threonine-protein kinase
MSAETWEQVATLFHQALELPKGERAAFLRAACADAELRHRVTELLLQDEAAEDYFQNLGERAAALHETVLAPDPFVSEANALAGRRIASYLLEREIGRGGTSVVYLASRAEGPFERAVAVKILTRQAHSVSVLRRFEREQQVLSDLSHPNIANLYDGGVTPDGYSYFVMEYVDGFPIDQYCDRQRLRLDERLRLFLKVARAVEYAHKHLVIHRDLKPSNVLVARDGTVKLLDFGVAKILTGDKTVAAGALTQTADRWLTPDYAAPEQVRGERTTTATDVYQLGMVLYGLLTGHGPYGLGAAGSAYLVEKAVCETEPRRPSEVVVQTEIVHLGATETQLTPESIGKARRVGARQLQRELAGDLDAILLHALQKDATQRYGSPAALADDIERYLEGHPVGARQGKLRYRARKFLRRHRIPVASMAVGLLLLMAISAIYVAAVAKERDRARTEAVKAGEVTQFVLSLFNAGHPNESRGEVLTAPMLLEGGVARAQMLADQPAVQAQILTTIGIAYHGLGDYDRSHQLLLRGLQIRRDHLPPGHEDIAHSLAHLGWSQLVSRDFQGAESRFRRALDIQRAVLGPGHPEVANSLHGLGLAINGLGRNTEAIGMLHEALAIRRAALGQAHVEIANGLNDLAILVRTSGDAAGMEQLVREALAMRRGLLDPSHPDIARSTKHLASILRANGDHDAAEPLLLEAFRIEREVLGEGHPFTRATVRALVELYESWGRPQEAVRFGSLLDGAGEAPSTGFPALDTSAP